MKKTPTPVLYCLPCLILLVFQTHCLFSQDWTKDYHFNSTVRAVEVMPTFDGGFAAAGQLGVGEVQPFLLKTSPLGDSLWLKTFGQLNKLSGCAHTPDGGFALIGEASGQVLLFKTDSLGNLQWQLTFEETVKKALAVAANSQGNLLVAGNRSAHPYLAKLDADGNLLWEKSNDDFPGPTIAGGDADRGFAFGHFNGMLSFLRTSPAGEEIWRNTFPAPPNLYMGGLEPASDGGLAMVGSYFVPQTDSQVAFRFIADGSGVPTVQGGFCCGADDYAFASSIVETPSGFALLWYYFTIGHPGHFFLQGAGPQLNLPVGLFILNTQPDGFILAGGSADTLRLMKIDQPWQPNPANYLTGNNFDFNIFPNPADGEFWIEFDLKSAGEVSVFATNPQGIVVGRVLEKQWRDAGRQRLKASTEGWQPGVYFLHFHSRNGRATRRLVK